MFQSLQESTFSICCSYEFLVKTMVVVQKVVARYDRSVSPRADELEPLHDERMAFGLEAVVSQTHCELW